MSTSGICGERSRRSPRVLITFSPCRASVTGSPTPARLNAELSQRLEHKRPLGDARMRDDQVAQIDALVVEQEDVDVDDARTPAARPLATSLALRLLGRAQQLARRPRPFALHDLVEKPRLVADAPRLGFYDATLTHYAKSFLTQSAPGSAEVASSSSEARAEAEGDDRQRMRSATRTARVICSTS